MKTILKMFIALSIVAYGCQQKDHHHDDSSQVEESAKVGERRQSVLAIHDEVMPLMSDIHHLKNELSTRLQDSSKLNVHERTQLKVAIRKLDSANQGMRVWMREFSDVKTTGVSEEEALKNLDREMERIQKVKDDMRSSVAEAKKLQNK